MKHILLTIATLLSLTASAEVKLPAIFQSGMVMQRDAQCNIWGTAEAGKTVTITASWLKKPIKATADAQGHFAAKVPTTSAGGPHTLTLSDGKKTQLSNILMGDLWLCAGQSNMEMTMKGFKGQPVEGANEALLTSADQQMRLFTVKRNTTFQPATDVTGQWQEASAASVRNFSATAYFFGRSLRAQLDVPIGLVVTAFGGSSIEAWMAPEWLKAFPSVTLPQSQADVDKEQQRTPTALYNGQLKPLIGLTMKGVIWYQGCTNVVRPSTYASLMERMVRGWREEWQQGDFPFYYCQITPYDYTLIDWQENSALLREQQAKAEQMIPDAHMVVLMDAGLEYGIHPRKKREAGERLAMSALLHTYGLGRSMPDYARYASTEFQGDTAVVAFDNSREWVYFNNGTTSSLFEIAGADKVFHPAKAWTSRNRIYLNSPEVKQPLYVRYAWRNWCVGDLMHDGLPVSSFRNYEW